ncbi:hypothetical protein H4582DRAFT_18202 [Lactarius indigo]|nr:hypothetical protein H4582DRAFT_18202 [Lactarius indigo]
MSSYNSGGRSDTRCCCTGNDPGGSSGVPSPSDRKGPPPPFTCTGRISTVTFSWKMPACEPKSSEVSVPRLTRTPWLATCLSSGTKMAAGGIELAPNSSADKEMSGLTEGARLGVLFHWEIHAWFGGKYAGKDMHNFLASWESPHVVPLKGTGEGLDIRGNDQLFCRSDCSVGVSTREDAFEEGDNAKEGTEVEPIGRCCCTMGYRSHTPSKDDACATGVRSGSGVIRNVAGAFFGVLTLNAILSRLRSSSRALTAARFVKIGSGFVFVLSQSARYAAHVSKCLPF